MDARGTRQRMMLSDLDVLDDELSRELPMTSWTCRLIDSVSAILDEFRYVRVCTYRCAWTDGVERDQALWGNIRILEGLHSASNALVTELIC